MKKANLYGTILTVFLAGVNLFGASIEGDVVDKQPVASTFSKVIDFTNPLAARASMQAIYAQSTPASQQLQTSGRTFANFTVSDWTKVQGRASTGTLTLVSGKNTAVAIGSMTVRVKSATFVEGVDWFRTTQPTNTWASLASAITAKANSEYRVVQASNVLTLIAASTGQYANAWSLSSSSPAAVTTGPWSNGNDSGFVQINGIKLNEGSSFYALTSTVTTAQNISNAIVANAALNGVVTSSFSQGVVYVTAAVNGANYYPLTLSASGFASLSTPYMAGVSTPPSVSTGTDIFTATNHGYATGLGVMLTTSAPNVPPTPLINQTTYYVIVVDTNSYKLATSSTNAVGGTAIDITALPPANSTFTFTPMPYSVGAASAKWQASNDGSNWTDLSVSSITNTQMNAGGNSVWDFGQYAYRYLRFIFLGPTAGQEAVKVREYGSER